MGYLTELDGLIALEDLEPHGARAHDNAPLVSRNTQPRDNATPDHLAIDVDEIEAWARQAHGANGLGDLATDAPAAPARPTSYESYRAARINRAFTLAEIIAEMVWAVGAFARRAYAGYRQRREANALSDTLRQLDDRMLRDLGFDRSEIRSVAAEVIGEAETTRLRVLLAHHPRW